MDSTSDLSEKRSIIEKAGMKLTDEELDMIAGGAHYDPEWERPYSPLNDDGDDGGW